MSAASLSMLDQYRETFVNDALVEYEGDQATVPGVQRHERMKVVTGTGYMEHHLFANGLLAGRGDYRLDRAHCAIFRGMETFLGASLMVDGSYDLAIPELRVRQRIPADQTWIRAGRVEAVHYAQPAHQAMRGISIDTTATLLEAWREEAPTALSAGVRAALKQSGPLLQLLPGARQDLRRLALRMLQVDSSTLCGRLQLESIALDFLATILQGTDETEVSLTPAERREKRLRIALDEARDILEVEWAAPPTIAELARRVGLNECYLKTGFRDRFGATIGAHARARRLQRARQLIEREGHGVQEAAMAVGFSNLGWFSSTFKQHFGCLPSSLARRAER